MLPLGTIAYTGTNGCYMCNQRRNKMLQSGVGGGRKYSLSHDINANRARAPVGGDQTGHWLEHQRTDGGAHGLNPSTSPGFAAARLPLGLKFHRNRKVLATRRALQFSSFNVNKLIISIR